MQETIFSNLSAGDESDEFKQQVGSPQEGFSIIKPDLDTELDIVNSCFALTESDREQKEDSEASFSTFLDQPHEGDKSTLLNILSESTPRVTKSRSVDGAKSSSHEELSSSKSFNDFCKPPTPEIVQKVEPAQEHRPDLQVFGFENPYFEVDFEKSDASDPSIRELKSERSTDSTEKMTDESTIGIFESQERKNSPERIQKQDTADQVPSQAFDDDVVYETDAENCSEMVSVSANDDLPEADRASQILDEKEELESMSSHTFSPSSSIIDFKTHHETRYSQSLTGSLERRLRRRTSQSSNSDHSSSSSVSRRSKYSDSTIVSRNRKHVESSGSQPLSDRYVQLKTGVFTYRMSPDDERRFLRRRNPVNDFDSGGSIEGSRTMSPTVSGRLTHSHSDSEDLSTLAANSSSTSNSFSHSVGNLSMFRGGSNTSSNYNGSNNSSNTRMSLGEIIFGSGGWGKGNSSSAPSEWCSTGSSSQTINSTTLY